jgi:beta-lactamase superfamily II metal-dependent hydrolase
MPWRSRLGERPRGGREVKLTVFQSEKGDCLLLESKDATRRVLVDGGMKPAYTKFVAPALGELAESGAKLDVVYVSHIDQDHIAGVLQLMDDKAAWKVHDFQIANGNSTHPEPDSPRPPDVKEVWHNAFHELVDDNDGEIADLLAASSAILAGADEKELVEIAHTQGELATSIPEAIRLSRRLGDDQLDIPLNKRFGGKLAFLRTGDKPDAIRLGTLRLSILGPFEEDLDVLRKEWNKWLKANKKTLAKIRKQTQADAERMGANDGETLETLDTLRRLQLAQATQLGNRKKVTPPNLASLMFFVSEGSKTLLLTGDGHSTDILKGLKFHGKLDAQGRVHVDVLKVQHHGSENNIDEVFVSKVTGDHYVFCGNGEHENPDLKVLAKLISSRLDDVASKATHPKAVGPFKLWFNSSESATSKTEAKVHMKKVRELVEKKRARSAGRLTAQFLEGETPSFEVPI